MCIPNDASNPPAATNASRRTASAAPVAQKTSRASSYWPVSGLERVEEAAARERDAVAVEEAARGAGVLEARPVAVLEQLGLRGDDARVVEGRHERTEPARRHLDVVVEEDDDRARRVRDGRVVAACEQEVLGVPRDDDVGMRRREPLGRAVGRCVVRDDDFEVAVVRRDDGRQEALEQSASVPGDEDDRDAGHGEGAGGPKASPRTGAAPVPPQTRAAPVCTLPEWPPKAGGSLGCTKLDRSGLGI